ncbi:hypothetical protein ACLOJK_038240, partial [Asimina triloba]
VSPSEDRLQEEPDRTEAPSIEQGIPMEEVPKVDRGEGSRARDVPQATSAPGGGDSGAVLAALIQMMQVTDGTRNVSEDR